MVYQYLNRWLMSLPMLMRERKSWWNCGISMSWNTSKICLNKVRLPVFPSVNNVRTWSTFFQQCLRINKTQVWIIRFGILNLHITVLIYKHLFFNSTLAYVYLESYLCYQVFVHYPPVFVVSLRIARSPRPATLLSMSMEKQWSRKTWPKTSWSTWLICLTLA